MKKEATTEINFSDHESTFSLSFSSIYRLFCAKANFFFKFVFATQIFLFFLISRKQTNFGVPREGTILLSVPQVELCCPLGQFLSFGLALLSFSGSLKLRFSFTRKTQKGQPLGQKLSRGTTKLNLRDTKQYCTLPRDTKICLFPLEKKKKKLSSKKNLQKKLALAKKSL